MLNRVSYKIYHYSTSRQLMKIIALLSFFLINTTIYKVSALQKPNVIIILTDDQGSVDLNCYGALDLYTPNMDKLVASGIKFTQFYAAPVCSPTRASLITGKTPQKIGITEVVRSGEFQNEGLASEEYTIAEMFKDSGYSTAIIGKWHLGSSKEKQPGAQGFDHAFGPLGGGFDNYSHSSYYANGANYHDLYMNGKEIYRDGLFFPDLMLNQAAVFLERNKSNPFFLYYALNVPHYPYQGTKEWLDYYNDKGVEYPRNLYAAFLSTMDENIGRLLSKIEALGLRENTIIVFQSDNGFSNEQRAHGGGGSSGPYRGHKGSLFEGGIRVPASISWSKEIQMKQVRNQMAVVADWMPTLADLCGISLNKDGLDGKSLVEILKDSQAKSLHDEYCWVYQNQIAVRKGKWKLLINPVIKDPNYRNTLVLDSPYFLSNLEEDLGESTNLALEFPEKVAELKAIYNKLKN